jgi:STE24 endopeptidase
MPQDLEKAKAYQRKKYFVALFHLGLQLLLLALFIASGASLLAKRGAEELARQFYSQATIYYSVFFIYLWVFDFLTALYSGFHLERVYGLSNQNFRGWLVEFAKRTLLSYGLSLLLVLGLYGLIRGFPGEWWIWAWGAFAGVSYLLGQLFPVLIVPLFYKYSRVENEALRGRIFALVKRFGLPLENVYSLNLSKTTKKANAMFAGLGRTKRLVLSDTLLRNFTEEEIESVVAHELGHYKHRDLWHHLGFNAVTSFFGFGLAFYALRRLTPFFGYEGASDLAAFPLLYLVFSLLGVLLTPLSNAYSRWREREADRFALKAMGASGFIPAMEKLALLNLADPKPHPLIEWWFYTHPPIEKRIRMAKGFLAGILMFLTVSCPSPGFGQEKLSEKEKAREAFERRSRAEAMSYLMGRSKDPLALQAPLAIELFNEAVRLYEKKEYELARQALEDSLRHDPRNPFAFELLGDIAYLEQDLEEALHQYEAAFQIRPQQELKGKIVKTRKERGMEEEFESFEGEHFVIKYRGEESGIEGSALRELLGEAYREIGRELGYFFKHKVVVLLYDEEEFRGLSGVPHWSSGIYDGKIRLPAYQKGLSEREIEQRVRHELTHTFVAEISRGRCPVWLNEGLAEYQEARVEPPDLRVFQAAVRTNTLFPLEALLTQERALDFKDPLEVALFYVESYHFVNYLIEKYGMFSVRQLLERFAEGKDSFEAIEEVLKISPLEVEKRWKETFPSN